MIDKILDNDFMLKDGENWKDILDESGLFRAAVVTDTVLQELSKLNADQIDFVLMKVLHTIKLQRSNN